MGINSLLSIVKKDLKIIGRSKFSAIMILLTPVLIILLAGMAFNSSGVSGIVLGVHINSETNLNQNLLNSLEENNFVIKDFELEKDCIDSVKLSQTQICVIFLNLPNETSTIENIQFYVDNSRINLAHSLVYYVENEIDLEASNISISHTQNLIDVLESTKNSLSSQKEIISSSIGNIEELNLNIKEISSNSNLTTVIQDLVSASNSMNESESKDKVDEAIILLNQIKTFNLKNSNDLVTQNEEILFILDNTPNKLDTLITSLEKTNFRSSEEIVSPVNIQINSLTSNSNNRDYLLPTILGLLALFGGVLLSSTLVLKERKTKAFFRNFITPTWDFTFILSCYVTCLIILIVQFILIFVGIEYLLKIPIFDILPEIGLILFIALSGFTFLGMFIGYLFKSEETTVFASVIISAALMFFSNTILPIESISSGFKSIANFNPVVVLDIALKKIILFGFSYSSILNEIIILGIFCLIFIVLAYLGRKITRRML